MRTPNEHQANGNTTEADITAQMHTILQNFEVLSSKADKYIFKYAYLYFIGFFLLNLLLFLISYLPYPTAIVLNRFNLFVALFELLFIVGIYLVIWTFNIWREQVPHTLRNIFENDRIYAPTTDDRDSLYLNFLKQYRGALSNPIRYLLSAFLMIVVVIHFVYEFGVVSRLGPYEIYLLTIALLEFGFMYCLGIIFWSLYISGQHFREMSRKFEFRIEPVHPDHCGGLNRLGKLCFDSGYPVIIGSAFYIGWMIAAIHFALTDVATIVIILSIVLLLALPVVFFASFRPLWSIHTKMFREREIDEQRYTASIMPLIEKITVLLNANQLEEAKTVNEKKELIEALFIPYPIWPFNVKAQFLTAIFSACGGLLLGVLTTLLQGFAQAILHLPTNLP
jgi:hypothetical protein